MANYLITGGCGFIGSNIVEYLVNHGDSVRVLDDLSSGHAANLELFASSVDLIQGSILDQETVNRAVRDMDFVLHHAALPSVQRSVENPILSNSINVDGTVNLLNACRNAGVKRVVYAASSSAYGDQPHPVKTEKLQPMPKSPYAVAKLSCEYYMRAFTECYGLETVSLRYFNVFGPRQDPNSEYSAVIPLFITKCLRGDSPTIYGDGTQSRDFTYVENNVRANVLAANTEGASPHLMNIACGRSFSLLDLLREINEVLGTDIKPAFAPARTGDVRHSLADISRAGKLINYNVTVDFHEGLRRTIEWYKSKTTDGRE
jgi:UDP-glucose 4-epimerase